MTLSLQAQLAAAELRWLDILKKITTEHLDGDPAHDMGHFQRVWSMAKKIAIGEGQPFDAEVLIAASWLHDVVNLPKNHPEVHMASRMAGDKAVELLIPLGFAPDKADALRHAVAAHSYSAQIVPLTPEARIVQDAGRLESVGAISIARTFVSCGIMRRAIVHMDDPEAKAGREPDNRKYGVDLFLTRMRKVPELLQTATAKAIARQRAEFTEGFIRQIAAEVRQEA